MRGRGLGDRPGPGKRQGRGRASALTVACHVARPLVCCHALQEGQAVEIVAQSLATDSHKAYETSSIELAGTGTLPFGRERCVSALTASGLRVYFILFARTGADMTRRAAAEVFKKAKLTPKDVQVVELHDCFSANEVRAEVDNDAVNGPVFALPERAKTRFNGLPPKRAKTQSMG